MDDNYIERVDLTKCYRLLNHGPTVLVSARQGGTTDVMAAAWACALDFSPPKVSVVLDKQTRTRELVERSGCFALQIPNVKQLAMTQALGTHSLHDTTDKLARFGVALFEPGETTAPLVTGCSGWLACRVVPEPHNQQQYDLFIGEVVAAWADKRVFRDGHWQFETADPQWRSLHYVAGGQYYAIGAALRA